MYKYYNIVKWYFKTLNWIELQCESLTDEQTIMKTVIIRWRTLTLFSGPCELNKNFIVQTQLRSISVLSVLNVIHHMYKQYFTEFSDIFLILHLTFRPVWRPSVAAGSLVSCIVHNSVICCLHAVDSFIEM